MSKLYFKIGSDWEEVVRLRNEIAKLKQELMSMDGTQTPAAFKALNAQLAASNQRLDELVTNAAKAGAEMETGFKRKIFDASQAVNGFTEKILAQKAVVKDIEADVKRLGDAYRIALKRNPLSANSKLEEYNAARKALDEEKAALFGLTQQQAEARLSVKKLRDEYALYNDNAKEIVESNNLSLIHISEPTRRTPISYAVFCLKKKKNKKNNKKIKQKQSRNIIHDERISLCNDKRTEQVNVCI